LKLNFNLNTCPDDLFQTLDFANITVFIMSEVDDSDKCIYCTDRRCCRQRWQFQLRHFHAM